MAIFTIIKPEEFHSWAAARYGFGTVGGLVPIAEGIENTNYRFSADGADYVFTIFELWDAPAVIYYANLMRHFAECGLPVVSPLSPLSPLSDADSVGSWEGKPCLVVPFVQGADKPTPTADDCRQIGGIIARLHIAAAGFTGKRQNPRDAVWRRQTAQQIRPQIDAPRQQLLDSALHRDATFADLPLPAAACHCDLFRNNVLWQDGRVAAVIDFYFGGEDALIFDIAVCVCDWCFDGGAFSTSKMQALLGGYNAKRRLTELEKQLFPDALSVAATRFWISRLYDLHFPRRAESLSPHDPQHFEDILRAVPPSDAFVRLIAEVA